MSQYNTSGHKGFVATAALEKGIAVALSGGEVVSATAGTAVILGVTTHAVDAGQVVDVRLRSAQGTSTAQAGGNVAVGDAVTATTGGQVITTTTANDQIVGYALEAGVAGDFIEVLNTTAKV